MAKPKKDEEVILEQPKKGRKTRVVRPALEAMAFALEEAMKAQARAHKIYAKAHGTFDRVGAKLASWGHASQGDLTLLEKIKELQKVGYVPPTGRTAIGKFAEGDFVRVKDKHFAKYATFYTEEELHSMAFGFLDAVNNTAVCTTDTDRSVYAKLSHIERRLVHAVTGT